MADIKVGMIGLDTSHCVAFVKLLHDSAGPYHVPGAKVISAFPGGTGMFSKSIGRVAGITDELREEHGVEIRDSIEDVGKDADAFLLESVDGRQHLEQFTMLAGFGKPVFIDKPLACSHEDARAIAALAREKGVPVMSASSVRLGTGVAGLKPDGAELFSCEAFGPAEILEDYPGYFWYGVHSADVLFSYMGRGCRSVCTVHGESSDMLVGTWDDGRLGTVRGTRYPGGGTFGCTLFTSQGTITSTMAPEPPGYASLMKQVVPFFQTGKSPIDMAETVEVMGFLDAAGKSLEKGGAQVELLAGT